MHLSGQFSFVPAVIIALSLVLFGCDSAGSEEGTTQFGFNLDNCEIPTNQIFDGTNGRGRNAIPALDSPDLVEANAETSSYLADDDRVIGLEAGGEALAVPHNVLWFHEIINFDNLGDRPFAVTYCPLTGSSLAFDRSEVDGAELRVSGLLFNNNLMMYDRRENESLWPQMSRKAECGAEVGADLSMLPVLEATWGAWKDLHPNTVVVSSRTGYAQNYEAENYPYADDYEQDENSDLLFDTSIDPRRDPKERVLGIPVGEEGGLALPFDELREGANVRVVEATVGKDGDEEEIVVFWSSAAQGAMAYRPMLNGQSLSFSVNENGRIVDEETGRTWRVDGRSTDGSARLEAVERAYVSFWFAWAAFQSDTDIWTRES